MRLTSYYQQALFEKSITGRPSEESKWKVENMRRLHIPYLSIVNFYPENIKQCSLQRLHTKIVVAMKDRDEGRTL